VRILAILGHELPIVEEERRVHPKKSEVGLLSPSNDRAKKLLDWKPTVSLQEGLIETINWVKENLDFYKPPVYRV